MNDNIRIENLDEDELIKLIGEEYEKCKDPVYFYNTYWRMADGSKPKPITQEQYSSMLNYSSKF